MTHTAHGSERWAAHLPTRSVGAAIVAVLVFGGVATAGPTAQAAVLQPLAAVNAGGAQYTAVDGTVFEVDNGRTGLSGGRASASTQPVGATEDDALYQTTRAGRSLTFTLTDLPAGTYEIELHFVEPAENGAGRRLFDVTAEGAMLLDDYDVFATVGAMHTARTETRLVAVTDGELTLDFTGVVRQAIVAAIEVRSGGTTPVPTLTATPAAVDFGTVSAGETASQSVKLTNSGSADVTITAVSTTHVAFTVAATVPAVLTPGTVLTVTVTFSPPPAGSAAGDLVVTTADGELINGATLKGTVETGVLPAGTMAVIGCSNTDQHIAGYLDASTADQFAPVPDLGGGTLERWYTNERDHWGVYEQNRPAGGYQAAWVQLCLRTTELTADNETRLSFVIDEIRARDGDVPIYVSPLNAYVEGHVCTVIGPDGQAVAAALADWASAEKGVVRGPDTGPLAPSELSRDGCHLNATGIAKVGGQLAAWFDMA